MPAAMLGLLKAHRRLSTSASLVQGWKRLIRFIGEDGSIHQGEPILSENNLKSIDGLKAKLIEGNIFDNTAKVTDNIVPIRKLLSPLSASQVPLIRCIGLNYKKHALETNQPTPKYPILFIKPSTAVQDPFEPVRLPKIAANHVDYEAELAVVIKKECKNVDKEKALEYVLGYTAGNDVSAREWQKTLGGGQWSFSKGFDTFSPLGPMLVSTTAITNPNNLRIRMIVNDVKVQDSNTSDMVFDVASLVSFLSQSTTLLPGTVILTGTPEGVGFAKNPPIYLKAGDKMTVEIENIGQLTNYVENEK
ncbi:5288_t:CDS:2 [Paraglomus occultum]|uniref:5288_t:CDS:1 n=1 Tax=Paraglomus occultum TaxID=144539 RepID=A0A9N9FVU4_9GLOM|nr:5288_t:CDS:2 [Paraglomus occultum]